jgi:hypothetical protein
MSLFTSLRELLARTRPVSPGRTNATEPYAAYRKCPQCGARDFRQSDRQRTQPDVYRSRMFRLKWLCLACGHRETETVEELD